MKQEGEAACPKTTRARKHALDGKKIKYGIKLISVEMELRLIFGPISELFLIIQRQLQMLLAISMHLVNNAARLLKLLFY